MPRIIVTNHTTNHALVLKPCFETSEANHTTNDTSETYLPCNSFRDTGVVGNSLTDHACRCWLLACSSTFGFCDCACSCCAVVDMCTPQDTLLFGGPAKLQRKGSVGVPQVEDGCHYSTRISIYCKTNIHLTRIVPRLRLYLCIHIIYTHVVRQGNHFWKVPFWTLNWHHPSIIRHPQPLKHQ